MSNLIQVERPDIHPTIFTDYEAATIKRAFKAASEKKKIKKQPKTNGVTIKKTNNVIKFPVKKSPTLSVADELIIQYFSSDKEKDYDLRINKRQHAIRLMLDYYRSMGFY